MSHPTAERQRRRIYRYGPHVVQVVRTTEENGDTTETLSVTRNGNQAAQLRGGHGYARLPKKYRTAIKKEVENRG